MASKAWQKLYLKATVKLEKLMGRLSDYIDARLDCCDNCFQTHYGSGTVVLMNETDEVVTDMCRFCQYWDGSSGYLHSPRTPSFARPL